MEYARVATLRWHQHAALAALGVAGVVLAVTSAGLATAGGELGRWFAFFLLTYLMAVLVGFLPEGGLLAAPRRWLVERVRENDGGFYGVAALSSFLYLEAASFNGRLPDLGSWRAFFASLSWLWGFGVDSFLNAIRAAFWPFHLLIEYGLLEAVAVFVAAGALFWLGSKVLPQHHLPPAA